MLKKIESLIITTENYDETTGFFAQKLGLEMPSDNEEMARFELGGFPIFVAKSERGLGSFITIETDDIEADYKLLQEKGVEFYEPISVLKGGDKASFFKGPAGVEFMLYQPAGRAG
jgi:catechol 2,3-dioxygenase-like lactoylglutathione lyase family enzyme